MIDWQGVVIHHSESHDRHGLDTSDIRRWHKTGNLWVDVGYHFLVEKVGQGYEVICGRFLDRFGAHSTSRNKTHIGVCLVGNFKLQPPPEAQLVLAARFVRSLQAQFKFDIAQVQPHYPDLFGCPGAAFPWRRFIDEVAA